MSLRKMGWLCSSYPSGCEVMSLVMFPSMAYATTRGGDPRYASLTSGCILPSKFRLPDKTAAALRFRF